MNRPVSSASARSAGERKQITAVFVDVVGFSDIASTADAEDLQNWLEDYYAQSRKIIEAHDGEVTEYLGDGVVALFGLARADELAAAKAVNAAIKAVSEINANFKDHAPIKLRAGVATGEVAVRAATGNDNLPRATGMVTTLAQRIQERAAPGTVMISESTQALLRGSVAVEPVPDQMLKGFAEPQTLFRPSTSAISARPSRQNFFVGRQAELARIADSDKPVLIVGQAGIGKTALCRYVGQSQERQATLAADGVHTTASYQAFRDWIIRQTGKPLPEFADVTQTFAGLSPNARRALALVLGLEEGQRLLAEITNVALKGLIEASLWEAIQTSQPDGLLVFEDLHWLDNASFGVLATLLSSPEASRYQILLTSREDTKISRYLDDAPITIIPLEALNHDEAHSMLDALGDTDPDPAERAALVEKAGGIPLFLEQLFIRRAAHGAGTNIIPGSLMDLLAEQIDATGPSKPVLQTAAIIGRNFTLPLLAAIAPDQNELTGHLAKACDRGVLRRTDPESWTFSHALLHQAAYHGMLRKTRIDLHAKVADHLQTHHADAVRRNPAMLTDHLTQSQQYVLAIQNYLSVSQWALFQGAFTDAEAHIHAAISLCAEAPADVDVSDLEIACYTALGSILMQVQGFTSPPVKDAFEAVARLANKSESFSAANGPAFFGSLSHAIVMGDKPASERFCALLAETAATVSPEATNHEVELASTAARICVDFYSGNFHDQFKGFAKLRGIYDIRKHGAMIANYGMDTFAAAQMFEVVARAIAGQTDQVATLIQETDAHQDMLNMPVMQPYALVWGAVPLFYAGEQDAALARLHRGIGAANEQAAAFWQVTGATWLHVMDPEMTKTPEGLATFDQMVKTTEMIGANVGIAYFRAVYATALARHGQMDEAFAASQRAVQECETLDLHCWYAEVLRKHAAICGQTGHKVESMAYLDKAREVAKRQGANLWHLRALLDLHDQGHNPGPEMAAALAAFPADTLAPEAQRARRLLAVT